MGETRGYYVRPGNRFVRFLTRWWGRGWDSMYLYGLPFGGWPVRDADEPRATAQEGTDG